MKATIDNTIRTMAEQAAESAVACFGKDDPPSARIAYSFIFQLQYDNDTEPMFPQLTRQQFRSFQCYYCLWLRNNGVHFDVATKAAAFR